MCIHQFPRYPKSRNLFLVLLLLLLRLKIDNLAFVRLAKSYKNGKLCLEEDGNMYDGMTLMSECPEASEAFDVAAGYLADEIIKKAEDKVNDWKINKAYTSEKGRKNLKDFIKRRIYLYTGSCKDGRVNRFKINETQIKKLQGDDFKIVKLSYNGETQLLP